MAIASYKAITEAMIRGDAGRSQFPQKSGRYLVLEQRPLVQLVAVGKITSADTINNEPQSS